MNPSLNSITITNFRSLRGTVTVPLNAPIVLIHGPNGSGKTSISSAIELALTSEIQAMLRTDPNYLFHLPHRGTDFGTIALTTSGVNTADPSTLDIRVTADGLQGAPLLHGEACRFFSERCYLAQATLSRLLEIYQYAKPHEDSPLTQFVKDLLGLNHLDALIEGLQPAGDLRNTRRLAPGYGDAEKACREINQQLTASDQQLQQLRGEVITLRNVIRQAIAALPSATVDLHPAVEDLAAVESFLVTDAEEGELIALAGSRRTLASLRQQAASLASTPTAVDQAAAEAEEREARTALDDWWKTAGHRLEALVEELRGTFPDLPSVASTDPELAFKTAAARVDTEFQRCEGLVAQDDVFAAQLVTLDQAIDRGRARIALIDEQLGQVMGEAEGLSRALAALVPHIHTEECPVCGRDYREVSTEPLLSHVSSQVARLTEQADRLQNLGKARLEVTSDLAKTERTRDDAARRRLAPENRSALKARVAGLVEVQRRLTDLAELAQIGADVIRREARARQRLAELRSHDRLAIDVRNTISELCRKLSQPTLEPFEPVADALKRLETHVRMRETELSGHQRLRREALVQLRLLVQQQAKIHDLEQTIAQDTAAKERLETALAEAERRRQKARSLSRVAADARTAIVGRVFNTSLNAIWRDLFVRLAPTEPFVPAFKLPQTAREPVSAQLETMYRAGGTGGTPGSMLSAGNLNTAALTLFLALHLSVKPQLPWLILDDPVQSMDEVHIAQFAALLRTISKGHDRQILIAVHERPLFDYLTLELSPAFPGDQLITVELSRSNEGASVAEPKFFGWEPDRGVAA
jgi:exonuclease SbcC